MNRKSVLAIILILGLAATLVSTSALGMGKIMGKGKVAKATTTTGASCVVVPGITNTLGITQYGEEINCGNIVRCASKTRYPSYNAGDEIFSYEGLKKLYLGEILPPPYPPGIPSELATMDPPVDAAIRSLYGPTYGWYIIQNMVKLQCMASINPQILKYIVNTDAARSTSDSSGFAHAGPPANLTSTFGLTDVKRPGDFSGEAEFAALDARTYRVEFSVPKTAFQIGGYNPVIDWAILGLPPLSPPIPPAVADPNGDGKVQLRGWYIKGDGVSNRHPLVFYMLGYWSCLEDTAGVPSNGNPLGKYGEEKRKLIAYFVAQGFDVLALDMRGKGYSEGLIESVGEDVFRVLDQLYNGNAGLGGRQVLDPNGNSISALVNLLNVSGGNYTAKTKPVALFGISHGAIIAERAMAMNYSSLPIDLNADTNLQPRKYNFDGVIELAGNVSPKYDSRVGAALLDGALYADANSNGLECQQNVYKSMDQWPGYLAVKMFQDSFSPDGPVDAYNDKLKGFKRIVLVHGTLGDDPNAVTGATVLSESFSYVEDEMGKFAKKMIRADSPWPNNTETTTLAQQVCMVPHSGRLSAADKRIGKMLSRELELLPGLPGLPGLLVR
jgi:pimeloyl-ACP methyl ester carboxylesterase